MATRKSIIYCREQSLRLDTSKLALIRVLTKRIYWHHITGRLDKNTVYVCVCVCVCVCVIRVHVLELKSSS